MQRQEQNEKNKIQKEPLVRAFIRPSQQSKFYTMTAPLPGILGSAAASNFPVLWLYPMALDMLTPGATYCTVCPSAARYAMVSLL